MSVKQAREYEKFTAMFPDHWDTLQFQIALIASFFANAFARKKVGHWEIKDFIPQFGTKKEEKKDTGIKEGALQIASLFGDDKTKKWAEKQMKEKGILIEEDYQYPLEKEVKPSTRLPYRLRVK